MLLRGIATARERQGDRERKEETDFKQRDSRSFLLFVALFLGLKTGRS